MRKLALTLLMVSVLGACSAGEEITVVPLGQPSTPYTYIEVDYFFKPTPLSVLRSHTHAALIQVENIQAYENDSIYTCSVINLLAGQLDSGTIHVLNPSGFYEKGEQYLLFFICHSRPEWPYDVYLPFDPYSFRVNGQDIDCFQGIDDITFERTYVKPFRKPEHNRLSVLTNYIRKHANEVKRCTTVSDHEDIDYLIRMSDVIVEIKTKEKHPGNILADYMTYEVTKKYQGRHPGHMLLFPQTMEENKSYLVFLKDNGWSYELMARDSFFPLDSEGYAKFKSIWRCK